MNLENKVNIEIYKSLLTSLPFGLIIVDTNKEILLYNENTVYFTEEQIDYYKTVRTPEEIGLYSLDKKNICKSTELPIDLALQGNIVKNKKYYVRNIFVPDGMYIKINAFPIILNENIIAAALIYEDITEEQAMYDSMITSFSELQNHLRNLLNHKKEDYEAI